MQQLSITERKVFDGRKQQRPDYPNLSHVLNLVPCEQCPKLFTLCDIENCHKLTEWGTQ
jgi:hypothetical protein